MHYTFVFAIVSLSPFWRHKKQFFYRDTVKQVFEKCGKNIAVINQPIEINMQKSKTKLSTSWRNTNEEFCPKIILKTENVKMLAPAMHVQQKRKGIKISDLYCINFNMVT